MYVSGLLLVYALLGVLDVLGVVGVRLASGCGAMLDETTSEKDRFSGDVGGVLSGDVSDRL